ncbi:hypothetical protein GE21DRAFT_1293366 [Neurospora crassa]|nr:hypothetical protein GE21DRAFT_1293366 [Neurospora crassa]
MHFARDTLTPYPLLPYRAGCPSPPALFCPVYPFYPPLAKHALPCLAYPACLSPAATQR